ncbi:fluoride efflux transporter CrcB [Neomoorella thermoacetica]|uniref:fluoride efflux transporter CrcB n=1 Tax=Neomoorella thermoacetica TaxID=1525 RepID=UPI0008FB57FF|nr:fluoride efflux transporter CrcB [Moorella thermoacetica]APC07639.1 putative fluoride ion transporter CrcB [Moorella thermoacetica]
MAWIYVGCGGIAGTLARFLLSRWLGNRVRGTWPLGTLFVNLSGVFLLGLLLALPQGRLPANVTLALGTGFVGAYTTFSTFTYETVTMIGDGEGKRALAYSLGSILGGLLLAWLGWLAAGSLF